MLKKLGVYRQLPSQTAQQILKQVDKDWKSFFKSMIKWKRYPNKFLGRPKPPKYKAKHGENLVIFTNQQCRIRNGYIHFPKRTKLPPVKTRICTHFHHVRIVPKGLYYVLEIIYDREKIDFKLDKTRIFGIDLGLRNIVTLVNNAGLQPAIIKGNVVKSINHFYNKQLARYKSKKDKQHKFFETKQLQQLTRKRNNLIKNFFHKISRRVVNYCIVNNFGTIVIGYNTLWKQKVKLIKKTNQNFVQIPFFTLIQQIIYKSRLVGISVIVSEESYTSKCSFLDNEPIKKQICYSGVRMSRGLFKSQNGTIINADVNAGYNIIRKVFPNAQWSDGIRGVGFHPYSFALN